MLLHTTLHWGVLCEALRSNLLGELIGGVVCGEVLAVKRHDGHDASFNANNPTKHPNDSCRRVQVLVIASAMADT